jgi:hypothetical protein
MILNSEENRQLFFQAGRLNQKIKNKTIYSIDLEVQLILTMTILLISPPSIIFFSECPSISIE